MRNGDTGRRPSGISRRAMMQQGALAAAALAFARSGRAADTEANGQQAEIPQKRLRNGVMMPMLGFGTFRLPNEIVAESVADAIAAGYRLIDTATVYENEEAVGQGIRKSGIDRKELFVTSKIWVTDAGHAPAKRAFQSTLDKLQLTYLDLWLIHRPRGDWQGSWRAMEELNAAGKIRAIGVSNFDQAQLAELMAKAKTQPVINQIETNAFFQEKAQWAALPKENVQMEAWAPFAEGRNGMFTNPVLSQVAAKHGRSVAQVVLRWHHQRGIVAIPRSSNPDHRRENLRIFDFALDAGDLQQIASLDQDRTQFPDFH